MNSASKFRGWIHNQADEQIQFLGSHIHQDVLANLVTGCESSRGELAIQLGGMRDAHGQLAQEMQHLPNDVSNKLVQNDQRNNTQEETIREFCTSMRNIEMQVGNIHKENGPTYQKATLAEEQMAVIGTVVGEKVNKQRYLSCPRLLSEEARWN